MITRSENFHIVIIHAETGLVVRLFCDGKKMMVKSLRSKDAEEMMSGSGCHFLRNQHESKMFCTRRSLESNNPSRKLNDLFRNYKVSIQ